MRSLSITFLIPALILSCSAVQASTGVQEQGLVQGQSDKSSRMIESAANRAKQRLETPGFALGNYRLNTKRVDEYATYVLGRMPVSVSDSSLETTPLVLMLEADAQPSDSGKYVTDAIVRDGKGIAQLFFAPVEREVSTADYILKKWKVVDYIPLQTGYIDGPLKEKDGGIADSETSSFAVRHFKVDRTPSFDASSGTRYFGEGKLVTLRHDLRKGKYLVYLRVDKPHETSRRYTLDYPYQVILENGIGSINTYALQDPAEEAKVKVKFTGWEIVGYTPLETAILTGPGESSEKSYGLSAGIPTFEIRDYKMQKYDLPGGATYFARGMLYAVSEKHKNGAHRVMMSALLENGEKDTFYINVRDGLGEMIYHGIKGGKYQSAPVRWQIEGIVTMLPAKVVQQPIQLRK